MTQGRERSQPAVPTVERGSIYPDTVKRGPMTREVHGLGTLVAEDVLWVPAIADGRVVKINVYPGTMVHPDTILMELDNPELRQQTLDAEFALKAAEAGYTDLAVQLKTQLFDKKSAAAQVTSDYKEAALHADRNLKLEKEGLLPKLDWRSRPTKRSSSRFVTIWKTSTSRLSTSRRRPNWPRRK